MIKRLLIPGLAIGALTLSAGSATAASFTLDTFNQTTNGLPQFVRSTRNAPNPTNNPNTQTGLSQVFGGSRQIGIDRTPQLIPPNNPSIRTTILVSPIQGELSISNGNGVISQTTARYDAGGLGFNNVTDAQGNSLGNWLTGRYSIDVLSTLITALDTNMSVSLRLGFASGKVGTVTRNAVQTATGTGPSTIQVTNNPTFIPGATFTQPNLALFTLTEFLGQNGITLQDFQSVSYAELKFTGAAAYDGAIDFIQGIEIPEPSMTIGTIVVVGLGFVSLRRKPQNPPGDQPED